MLHDSIMTEWQSQNWDMESNALNVFLQKVSRIDPDKLTSQEVIAEVRPKNNIVAVVGGVAVIPIRGVLLESVPFWFDLFEIVATAYGDIIEQVQSAVGNPETKTIRLEVDSGGGTTAGSQLTADVIFQAKKHVKVEAHISNMGASAAFKLASQAEVITAGPDALVGSIGTFWVFVDSSKMAEEAGIKVHVIKSGEQKGMGVEGAEISQEQIDGIQSVVDELSKNFISIVSRGRGKSKSVVKTWATGQVWVAKQAKELGLIDKVANNKVKFDRSNEMSESKQEHTDASVKAGNEKVRQETVGLLTQLKQAFPDNLEFAVSQYEAGYSVQEAKAEYADVLEKKLAEANQKISQQEKDKTKTDTVDGVPPLQQGGGSPESNTGENFHEKAKRIARENKTTYAAAASRLSEDEPDLYSAYQIACTKRKAGDPR